MQEIERSGSEASGEEGKIVDVSSASECQSDEPQDGAPQWRDGEPVYYVEKILDKKMQRGGAKYKVKWVGWPESQCTWEPLKNLQNVQDLVHEFDKKRADRRRDRAKALKTKNKTHPATSKRTFPENEGRVIDLTDETLHTDGLKSEDGQCRNDQDKNQRKKKGLSDEGHLKYKDKPNKIIMSKIDQEDKKLLFLVDWLVREDGMKPLASFISNDEFKKYNPVFLLEYYESKLVYFAKKIDSNDNGSTAMASSTSIDRTKRINFELRSSLATEALEKNLGPEKKSPMKSYE